MTNVIPFTGQVDHDGIAINFFSKVLPATGLYFGTVKKGKNFHDFHRESIEALWMALRDADRSGWEVYFCTASFSTNLNRTIDNIDAIQSFNVDVDFGPGHSAPGYETFDAARDSLKNFCIKASLPVPIVIKSGGGLHAHWPLREPLTRAQWQPYADGLKAACVEKGLRCDNGLTVNPAHIMRPPGTSNRKLALARPVEATMLNVEPYPLEAFDALQRFSPTNRLAAARVLPPRPNFLGAFKCDEAAFPEHYQQVRLDALAAECGVVAEFQRSGDHPEPAWMRLANLFRYVEDGEQQFHKLSANGYPKYDRRTAQAKYDRAAHLTGPPKCAGFRDECGEQIRNICLTCPHLDTIVTPLQAVQEEEKDGLALNVDARVGNGGVHNDASIAAKPKKSSFIEWDKTEKGVIRSTYKNTVIAIGKLELACKRDSFHMKNFVSGEGVGPDLDDAALRSVREAILARFRFDCGKDHVTDALYRECERNSFDPVADYLRGLQWDGEPRLDGWLHWYLGAEDTPLNRVFGRKVLLAAVRRVFQRGCKFDHLIVLEGPQRAGKSTAWQILAGSENFSDAPIKWDDPKQQKEILSAWIHEIPELVGLRKADIEAIKSFLSRQVDRGRAAYDRTVSDQPRRGIVVGTTNLHMSYLNDPTGGSRFWPVKIGKIDLEALAEDRDQLWAETVRAEAAGESLALPPEHYVAAALQQDLRQVAEPWVDFLGEIQGDRISTAEIALRFIGVEKAQVGSSVYARIANAMRRLGWDGPKVLTIDGKSTRGYDRV